VFRLPRERSFHLGEGGHTSLQKQGTQGQHRRTTFSRYGT
jgi:hypothetical protein